MASAPPPPPILTTSLSITRTLTDFLTVALHTLLHARSLYPATSFLTTRSYNLPGQQSRHPAVCAYILSSISHLTPLLLSNALERIIFVVFSDRAEVLERWVFDVSRLPVVDERERYTEFEEGRGVSVDVEEQLRGALMRLQIAGSKLESLPRGCTWGIVVEVKEDKEAPIGHPQAWVPSEPGLQVQREEGNGGRVGKDRGGVRSTPVRLVEAGDFVLEMWIEEGRAKFEGGEG